MTTAHFNAMLKAGSADVRERAMKAVAKKLVKVTPRLDNGMNKLEAAYQDHLWWRKYHFEIRDYAWTGNDKTRAVSIGAGRRYTPDFIVTPRLPATRLELHEVKGYLRDGGSLRFDLAAAAHPEFVFRMFRRVKGEWVEARTWNERH